MSLEVFCDYNESLPSAHGNENKFEHGLAKNVDTLVKNVAETRIDLVELKTDIASLQTRSTKNIGQLRQEVKTLMTVVGGLEKLLLTINEKLSDTMGIVTSLNADIQDLIAEPPPLDDAEEGEVIEEPKKEEAKKETAKKPKKKKGKK